MYSVDVRRLFLLAVPVAVSGFLYACSSEKTGEPTDTTGGTIGSTTAGSSTGGSETKAGKFAEACDAGDQCESTVCCLPGVGCGPGGGAGGGGGGGGGQQGNNNYWCSARCDAGPQCPNTLDGGAGACSKNGYCQR